MRDVWEGRWFILGMVVLMISVVVIAAIFGDSSPCVKITEYSDGTYTTGECGENWRPEDR